jgi:hypothetical protein
MEALDTDHALFLQLPFIRLRVDLAVGQHALGPELKGLHGEGDALKLLTDMDEISGIFVIIRFEYQSVYL